MNDDPEAAGFAAEKLEKLHSHLDGRYVAPQKIAGCSVRVVRKGIVAYDSTLGRMDIERDKAMRERYNFSYLLHVQAHHLSRADDAV